MTTWNKNPRFATAEDATVYFRINICGKCKRVKGFAKNCCFRCFAEWMFNIEAAAKRESGIMHDSDKWDAFVQEQSAASYWRERCHDAEERANKCGNSAKLRGALEKAKKAICHSANYVCDSLSWENSNAQSNCADILCAYRDLCEAKTAINAALAALPRNCDVYETEYDANAAFDKMCAQRGDGIRACIGCKYKAAERGGFPSISRCRVAWLFDAAQEGGDHADA